MIFHNLDGVSCPTLIHNDLQSTKEANGVYSVVLVKSGIIVHFICLDVKIDIDASRQHLKVDWKTNVGP